MKRISVCGGALALVVGCSGGGPKTAVGGDPNWIAERVVEAFETEARKSPQEAFDAWTKILESTRGGGTVSRGAALTALQSLFGRSIFGLEGLGDPGLFERIPDGDAKLNSLLDALLTEEALDPVVRVQALGMRMRLAAKVGSGERLAQLRKASGCATEATIVGPFVGPPLSMLEEETPVDRGRIDKTYPPPKTSANAALALGTGTTVSTGNGCSLDVTGSSKAAGLRYVAVDVTVPSAQRVSIVVRSPYVGSLSIGGQKVFSVAYGELTGGYSRAASAEVNAAGRVRVLLKIAAVGAAPVSIYALGEGGVGLSVSRAAEGEAPVTSLGRVASDELELPKDANTKVRFAHALGLSSLGRHREAESVLATLVASKDPTVLGGASLAYARELLHASDLPGHRRLERISAAFSSALAAWPDAWEAILGHAEVIANQRKGGAGEVEAIIDVKKKREALGDKVDPLVDAYLALSGDQVFGTREEALARAMPKFAKTVVGYNLSRATAKETFAEYLKVACDEKRPDVSDYACANARLSNSDYKGTLEEVTRLRNLWGAPREASGLEFNAKLRMEGVAAARALYEASPLSERSSGAAALVVPEGEAGLAWLAREIRLLEGDPKVYGEVVRARRAKGDPSAGKNVTSLYESRAKPLVDADRKSTHEDVGTLILAREEQYEIGANGFVHAVVWDVRRLEGTADVESNAIARVAGTSAGRGFFSKSILRIWKHDGTTVEPDAIKAEQAGAELSQIETGDYVEMLAEGWFLPAADGALDLDTADLLPQRTAVEKATISLAMPAGLKLDLWSHPDLGKAAEGATPVTPWMAPPGRSLSWTLEKKGVRRSEKGQAGMDAGVAVRLGTWSWDRLGRDAHEGLLSEVEKSPEVSAWVAGAVGSSRNKDIDLLDRLVRASKRAIPRVGALPMMSFGLGGSQAYNARTVLLDAQGSRIALLKRALDELGVKNEVVWSEVSPYSADPKMVARPWRFAHALLVAYVAEKPGEAEKAVWLDPDVDGWPPPPGRLSPELRGRSALNTKGEIVPVPPSTRDESDTATIDLTVDDAGVAKGTFTLLVRSHDAQDIQLVLEENAISERDDALRGYVLSFVPNADVRDVKASTETYQVIVSAKLEIPGFLSPDGAASPCQAACRCRGEGRGR